MGLSYPQPRPSSIHVFKRLCDYVVDFVVIRRDGTIELVEVKGGRAMRTAVWSLKRKLLEAKLLREHPEIIYTIEQ